MNKKIVIPVVAVVAIVVVGLVFALSGDKGDKKTSKDSTSKVVTSSKSSSSSKATERIVFPLTGVETSKVPDNPAISVKIENDPAARPQTGLENADIVWETMVEGGVSRFIATYQSQTPKEVGPVRSLRIADGPIVAQLHGLIAFSGSNGTRFQQVAEEAGNQLLENGKAGEFTRSDAKVAPHNLYFNVENAVGLADNSHKKVPSKVFNYAYSPEQASATQNGQATAVTHLTMGQNAIEWTWDTNKKAFTRSQSGVPFMAASGSQIQATNVIALHIETSGTPELDPSGTPEMDMHVTGSGTGFAFTDGKYIDIKWSKKDNTASWEFKAVVNGKETPLVLNPGNTWVEFVPTTDGGSVTPA